MNDIEMAETFFDNLGEELMERAKMAQGEARRSERLCLDVLAGLAFSVAEAIKATAAESEEPE